MRAFRRFGAVSDKSPTFHPRVDTQARRKFERKRAILVCELHGQVKRVRESGPMAFIDLLTSFKDIVGSCVRGAGMDATQLLNNRRDLISSQ